MAESHPHWIDDDHWRLIRALVPVTCVDLVPVRGAGADVEVGLIERDSPFGLRWCQIGGRLRHGETVRDGLLRHVRHTLDGLEVELPADPQPDYVMQWFPQPPDDGVGYGHDPRQHAVALCFLAAAGTAADPRPVEGGEAVRFGWFAPAHVARLGDAAWPGTAAMIAMITRGLGDAARREHQS